MLHQILGLENCRILNPADNVFRRACLNSLFQNNARGFYRALLSTRMRRKDNAVAGLERNQRLENCGRSRIRRRNNAGNHAQRLRNLNQPVGLVFFQNAAGFGIFEFVVNVFRRKMVFDDLVFNDAHTGFFNRHFRQRNSERTELQSHAAEDVVNLFLRIFGIFLLRRGNACHQLVHMLFLCFFVRLHLSFFCHSFHHSITIYHY